LESPPFIPSYTFAKPAAQEESSEGGKEKKRPGLRHFSAYSFSPTFFPLDDCRWPKKKEAKKKKDDLYTFDFSTGFRREKRKG